MPGVTSTTEQKRARKQRMLERTHELFSKHSNFMIVSIYKVRSTQFKDIASQLPAGMKILFAKKKIIKKVLRDMDEEKYRDFIEHIRGNVIVIFFDGEDPRKLLEVSLKNMRKAHAVPGDIALTPIVIPAGPTGLAPEKINFFQSARIQTKINKGKIDVASDHVLVQAGNNVSISDANLLHMLNIMPFEFGADVVRVYEGTEAYDRSILLITESAIEDSIRSAIANVAAVSLGLGILTEASVPYEIARACTEVKKVMLGLGMGSK